MTTTTTTRRFKGDLLKEMLGKRGRHQTWLASEMGKGVITVWRWCNNVTEPGINEVYRICQLLECTEAELGQ